jgi:hypothetical protein
MNCYLRRFQGFMQKLEGDRMRRTTFAVFVVIILLTVNSASAQDFSPSTVPNQISAGNNHPSSIGILGQGLPNYIPIWYTVGSQAWSVMYQDPNTQYIGVNTKTPVAAFDVSGGINALTNYQIGAKSVLGIGASADQNLFLGVGAGASNIAGRGIDNTFTGFQAGSANTTGLYNTFNGTYAGSSNTTGTGNTFSGTSAGRANTTGTQNTFSGLNAGYSNAGGSANTFSGGYAGFSNTGGSYNSFSGGFAGYSNTSGSYNTFSGNQAGYTNDEGSYNVYIGYNAGNGNTIGNNNIYIGSGSMGIGYEYNAIRIGGRDGNQQTQVKTFIAGIYGYISYGIPVYIDSDGKLGTDTSSRRFKEQIADMGESTNALMKLRPVTFLYKPEYLSGQRTLQYGLIAEEVAEVYPELVAYDKDGQPFSVRYQYLPTMLLNEVQKQQKVIATQQVRIEDLESRLARLEKAMTEK